MRKAEIFEKLYEGQNCIGSMPLPFVVRKWIEDEAKKKGYETGWRLALELREKHKDIYPAGDCACEHEYAKAMKFPIEDYWKARLAGAGDIRTALDIARVINEKNNL